MSHKSKLLMLIVNFDQGGVVYSNILFVQSGKSGVIGIINKILFSNVYILIFEMKYRKTDRTWCSMFVII